MLPIALDLSALSILLVGSPEGVKKRRDYLQAAGAVNLHEYVDQLPAEAEIIKAHVVLGVDVSAQDAEWLATTARRHQVLVNIEDVMEHCDFYYSAFIERGDLTIAVNTGGASPTLTRRVKEYIARRFGAEWAGYTQEIAEARKSWRAEGLSMQEVLERSTAFIEEKGWLQCKACPSNASGMGKEQL